MVTGEDDVLQKCGLGGNVAMLMEKICWGHNKPKMFIVLLPHCCIIAPSLLTTPPGNTKNIRERRMLHDVWTGDNFQKMANAHKINPIGLWLKVYAMLSLQLHQWLLQRGRQRARTQLLPRRQSQKAKVRIKAPTPSFQYILLWWSTRDLMLMSDVTFVLFWICLA